MHGRPLLGQIVLFPLFARWKEFCKTCHLKHYRGLNITSFWRKNSMNGRYRGIANHSERVYGGWRHACYHVLNMTVVEHSLIFFSVKTCLWLILPYFHIPWQVENFKLIPIGSSEGNFECFYCELLFTFVKNVSTDKALLVSTGVIVELFNEYNVVAVAILLSSEV